MTISDNKNLYLFASAYIGVPTKLHTYPICDPVDYHAVNEIRKVTGWDHEMAKELYLKLDYSWMSFVTFMLCFAREPNENEIEFIKKFGAELLIKAHQADQIKRSRITFKFLKKNKRLYRFIKK